jgi:hypothetical protein
MKQLACIVVMMVVTASCGDNLTGFVGPPPPPADSSTDGPFDADIDAGVDAPPPPSLTELCGAEPMTLDDWENCYTKRWCEWSVGCLPMNKYRDVQECLDQSSAFEGGKLAAARRERERAVVAGRASINIPAFTQCLADTSRSLCNTAQFSVACAARFTGTIGDGGSCYTDVECTSPGATCVATCADACCLGTCRPKVALGETCDTATSCEPGLRCDQRCFSGDIGTACTDDGQCDSNAWCDADVCRADFAPGADCTNPLQCGGETSCISLTIGSSLGRCLRISHAGDRCDYYCRGNLYCDASGTCREMRGLGQSCSGSAPCGGVDTICSSGQCVLRRGIGESCSTSHFCLPGLFCTSELNEPTPTCALQRSEGETCAAPSHCASYLCSGNPTQHGICLPWSETCPPGGT